MSHLKDITKELYHKCLNNSIYTSLFLSILIVVFVYKIWGIQFGWLDDVLQSNYFRSITLNEPIQHFFTVHILISKVYQYLYSNFPGIAWYGWIMLILVQISTANFIYIYICYIKDSEFKINIINILVFILLLFIWIEFIVIINFTRVAIILIGTSFINLEYLIKHQSIRAQKLKFIYFFITLEIGILTRPEVLFILIPFFIIYLLKDYRKNFKYKIIFLVLIFSILIFKCIEFTQIDQHIIQTRKTVSHMVNVTDGMNLYGKDVNTLFQNDIDYRAALLNYMPDSNFYSAENLSKWGPESSLDLKNLINIKKQLIYEFKKSYSNYSNEYLTAFNWFWKVIFFLVFNIMILSTTIFQYVKTRITFNEMAYHIILFLSFWLVTLAITALSKMEDRVFTPSATIFSLCQIITTSKNIQFFYNAIQKYIISIAIFSSILIFIQHLNSISNQLKNDIQLKEAIIEEINQTFTKKIIFYDIWSMTLLHSSALNNIYLNKSNQHLNYGEYWSSFLPEHQKHLKKFCNKTDFINFYQCLYQQRENIVFVSTNERLKLIEEYSEKKFNIKIRFKRIHKNAYIDQINYSFLPFRYNFGYYVFDNSFSDVK